MNEPLKVIAGAPDRPLVIGDIEIPCYVLEDETRVLSQGGLYAAIGAQVHGTVAVEGVAKEPRFAASKAISSYKDGDLRVWLRNPILFEVGGNLAYGYPATLLVDICDALLEARNAGSLHYRQIPMAERCELIIRGLANVGITALVDEATGYQELRPLRALAEILEQFIAEELQPWTKTFPFEFYRQIFRLKGWGEPDGTKRPSVIGHYTNDLVYDRIAPYLLELLRRRNPSIDGRRESHHHRWFTPYYGHPKLKEHIAAVLALMKISSNWDEFYHRLDIALPKRLPGDAPDLFDDYE